MALKLVSQLPFKTSIPKKQLPAFPLKKSSPRTLSSLAQKSLSGKKRSKNVFHKSKNQISVVPLIVGPLIGPLVASFIEDDEKRKEKLDRELRISTIKS